MNICNVFTALNIEYCNGTSGPMFSLNLETAQSYSQCASANASVVADPDSIAPKKFAAVRSRKNSRAESPISLRVSSHSS